MPNCHTTQTRDNNGPFVTCTKHGTCRMNCNSPCNTMQVKETAQEEKPAVKKTRP